MKKTNLCTSLFFVAVCGLTGCGTDGANPADGDLLGMDSLLAVEDTPAPYRITRDTMTGRRELDGEAHEAHDVEVTFINATRETVNNARPLESYRPSIRTGSTRTIDRGTNAVRTATINAIGDTVDLRGPEGTATLRVDPSTNAIYVNGRAAAGSTPAERLRNATRMFAELRVVQSTSSGQLAVLDSRLLSAPDAATAPTARGAVWRGIKKAGSWVLRNVILPRFNPTGG